MSVDPKPKDSLYLKARYLSDTAHTPKPRLLQSERGFCLPFYKRSSLDTRTDTDRHRVDSHSCSSVLLSQYVSHLVPRVQCLFIPSSSSRDLPSEHPQTVDYCTTGNEVQRYSYGNRLDIFLLITRSPGETLKDFVRRTHHTSLRVREFLFISTVHSARARSSSDIRSVHGGSRSVRFCFARSCCTKIVYSVGPMLCVLDLVDTQSSTRFGIM